MIPRWVKSSSLGLQVFESLASFFIMVGTTINGIEAPILSVSYLAELTLKIDKTGAI